MFFLRDLNIFFLGSYSFQECVYVHMRVWICALKCRESNSPGDGVTASFELSNMGADIKLRSSARTVCILDYWTELSPAPGLNLFHLRFVLSSQILAHVLMNSSGNFSFPFIDFKLPIFCETLWFIIKLFVVSIVCGAHCLLALFLLCPMWYSGMSRLILVLIFFLVSPVPQCLFRSVLQSPVFVYLLFTSIIWDSVSAELNQLTVSSSRLPVNSLLFTRGPRLEPVYHHASFSTGCWGLISGARDCVAGILRWGHIPSSFLVLFMWSSYFLLSFLFKGFSLVFDGGQICEW